LFKRGGSFSMLHSTTTWHHHPAVKALLAQQTHVLGLYQLALPAEQASQLPQLAQAIANGQTIGTQQPNELTRLSPWLATLVAHTPTAPVPNPHPNQTGWVQSHFVLAFPLASVGVDLGSLQTVLFGKVSMSGCLRWLDVAVPETLAQHWQGNAWGSEGIAQRLGLNNASQQPLLMAIFKPCLGETPERLGELLLEQALAGTHLVKDDEVLSDATLEEALLRLKAYQQALAQGEAQTGHRPLVALNLTGPAHELISRAQALVAAGAEAFLFNYLAYGLPLLNSLRQVLGNQVALIAHPALGGAFYQSPLHGLSPALLFGTLPRLAGADAVLFPSPYGSVCLPLADAQAVQHALTQPHSGLKPAYPVPSAGIQASMVGQIITDFGQQVIINAGTGIHQHPEGSIAGAKAFLTQFPKATAGNTPHA
jgi:2,3-diketo-5-methylthiopentyl-1-phosphate enolase